MMKRLLLILAALLLCVPLVGAQDEQELPDIVLQTATQTAERLLPGLGLRDGWSFEILFPSSDSALNCPLVPGYKTDTVRLPFVVSLEYGEQVYRVHISDDASLVVPCDLQLGAATVGTSALQTDLPQAADACQVTPTQGFANVRLQPSTDAPQPTTIETTKLVLGRNENTTWYLTDAGWVAGTVVNPQGDCSPDTIPARDPNITTISANAAQVGATPNVPTPAPGVTPTALPDFTCPPGFEGYLAPRLQRGPATARVEQGGVPNRIRALPTLDSQILGEIQPGRTIDFVYDGPRCSGVYVWWEIEIDGVRGWTATSNAELQEYFLIPTEGNEATFEAAAAPDTPDVDIEQPDESVGATAIAPATLLDVQEVRTLTQPDVRGFRWDENRLLYWYETGFDSVQTTEASDFLADVGVTDITAVHILPGSGSTIVGSADGSLVIDSDPIAIINTHESQINVIAFNPDGTRLVTGSGSDDSPAESWTFNLWDAELLATDPDSPAALLRTVRFPYPVRDAAFSADGESLAIVAETADVEEPAAALWVYGGGGEGSNTFTLALEPSAGLGFVTAVPLNSGGDFIYAQGTVLNSLTVATGEETTIAQQNIAPIADATFSATTEDTSPLLAIVSAAEDAPIAIYNYDTLQEGAAAVPVATVAGLQVGFSANNRTLAVLDNNNVVRLYAVVPE